MAQWGKTDQANNAPFWVGAIKKQAVNADSRDSAFGNVEGGVFAASTAEAAVNGRIAHAGWVYRHVGTGGRAGRLSYETLVAMSSITSDAEDVILPEAVITFGGPVAQSVFSPDAVSFAANVTVVPANASVLYQWQANTGAGFVNLAANAVYTNVTSATLPIANTTGLTGVQYRVIATVTGAGTATSNAAALTVTVPVLTIATQPANDSKVAPAAASFTVGATIAPAGSRTINYQWQANTGAGFVNLAANAVYTNVTSATLPVANTTGLNGVQYRVLVLATGATTLTSNAATLTVT